MKKHKDMWSAMLLYVILYFGSTNSQEFEFEITFLGGTTETQQCGSVVFERTGIRKISLSGTFGKCTCKIRASNNSIISTGSRAVKTFQTSTWKEQNYEASISLKTVQPQVTFTEAGTTKTYTRVSSLLSLETDCKSFDFYCEQSSIATSYVPVVCETTTADNPTIIFTTSPSVDSTNDSSTISAEDNSTLMSSKNNIGLIAGIVCVVLALLAIAAIIIIFILYKKGRFDSCLGFSAEKQGDSGSYDDVVTGDTISPYSETESKRYQADNNSPAVPSAVARNRGPGPNRLGAIREEISPYGVTHMNQSDGSISNGEISPYGVTSMSNFNQSKSKDEISPYGTTEMSEMNQSNIQSEILPYGVTEMKTTHNPHIMNSQEPSGIPQGEVSPYGVTEMSQIQSRERLDPTLHYADINVDMLAPKPVESPYEISNIGPGSITYADLAISHSGDSKPKPKIKSKPNVGSNRDQQGDDGLYEGVTKPDIASLYAQPMKKKDRK